jgi:acetyltransferase-like isoleucine patch superfamily enzyme
LRFREWKKPEIVEGQLTKWNWMVQHAGNLEMGQRVDIGAFTYINAKYGVIIRDDVQIGSHCAIYSVSTIDDKQGQVVLEENCRIGTHSVVMPNVRVGKNAIVGAFSFVNRDVPASTVAIGVPAKVVKKIDKSGGENTGTTTARKEARNAKDRKRVN